MAFIVRMMVEKVNVGAVMRITEAPVLTINAWVNRGLVPGLSDRTQGVARMFDLDSVLHVAVMAHLVRLGLGATFASMAASQARFAFDRPGATLVIATPRRGAYGLTATPTIDFVEVDSPDELEAFLDSFVDGRPECFLIVELNRIYERVRQSFENPDLSERAKRQRGVESRRAVQEAVQPQNSRFMNPKAAP